MGRRQATGDVRLSVLSLQGGEIMHCGSRDCTRHRVCHCGCEDCESSRLESGILYDPVDCPECEEESLDVDLDEDS